MLRNILAAICLLPFGSLLAAESPPEWKTLAVGKSPVLSMQWLPDERHLATVSADAMCRIWDVAAGNTVKEFSVNGTVAAFAGAGDQLAVVVGSPRELAIHRLPGGELIRRCAVPADVDPQCLAFSPRGDRIAAGAAKTGAAVVWDVATGKVVKTMRGHVGNVTSLRFLEDGRRLVTAGEDQARVRWNVGTGQEETRWSTPAFAVSSLDISTDGRYLAEAGASGDIVIREAATQKVTQVLRDGEDHGHRDCRFLKNSALVLTSNHEGILRLWDSLDGRELLAIRDLPKRPPAVSVSPSGTLLAAATGDEEFRLRVWKLPRTIWRRRTGPLTLAVLAFESAGTSPAQARLRESLVDGLAQTLAKRPDVRIVERGSAAFLRAERGLRSGFTSETEPLRDVESAEFLVTGSLQEQNGQLQVSVKLHVVGRVEPIAQWAVTGTAEKLDETRSKVIDRLTEELDLSPLGAKADVAGQPFSSVPRRLAVLPFRNQTGDAKRDDWAEGLADLLTVSLGSLDSISLVERQALEAVLREQKLQAAQLVEPATAIRLGQLAGADWVLLGSMTGTADELALSARVVDVASTRIIATREHKVAVAKINDGLAELVAALQHDLFPKTPLPADRVAVSTKSLEFTSQMARARRLLAEKKTTEGIAALEQALLLEPKSFPVRLTMFRAHVAENQWEQILEAGQALRDLPEFQAEIPYFRFGIASLEIEALRRLRRFDEIRRRAPAWEQECGRFASDVAYVWKLAVDQRTVGGADRQKFAEQIRQQTTWLEPLRSSYIGAMQRLRKGSVEEQLAACQDVLTVVDHVLAISPGKRGGRAIASARTIVPNGIETLTYYERQGAPHTQFLKVEEKIERYEKAIEAFGWIPETNFEALYRLAHWQRVAGRFDAAAETYLKLVQLPFPRADYLPSSLDRFDMDPSTPMDQRIYAWSGWAQLRAQMEPAAAQSALETAIAEVGAVHDRGPELLKAAADAEVTIRWPDNLALIWGGGHSTWQSWKNVLTPLGLRVHPMHRIGVTPADLEPYQLIVLVRSGAISLLPGEILALRGHVARGGRLLVVLSPGWDAAQPPVYHTLLDLFGFRPGEPLEVRTLSTKLADHPATQGLSGAMAKTAVNIHAPPETQLILSNDRCMLAARDYRAGRIAVASFGQWLMPDISLYGTEWFNSVYPEYRQRPAADMPFADGVDAQRELLDQLLKWMLTPVAVTESPQIDARYWRLAGAAIRNVQARAKPPEELPAILEELVGQARPGTEELEEALWFAGEASQGYLYYSSSWQEGRPGYGLGPDRFWPAQPEFYDRLIAEFEQSPYKDLAQFRRADALRRSNASKHAAKAWTGDGPYPEIIAALEKVESQPGKPAWAWQQLRLGRLKQADKPGTANGLENFQAVADKMPPSPEQGLAVQSLAMIHLEQGRRAEAVRLMELLLTDIPDFYFGGPSPALEFDRWKPLDDTFRNAPLDRQSLSINLRALTRMHLARLPKK